MAAVFFADLFSLLLQERLEGIKTCGALLASSFLSFHHGLGEGLNIFVVALDVRAARNKSLVGGNLHRSRTRILFRRPHAFNAHDSSLRPAVALFLNLHL